MRSAALQTMINTVSILFPTRITIIFHSNRLSIIPHTSANSNCSCSVAVDHLIIYNSRNFRSIRLPEFVPFARFCPPCCKLRGSSHSQWSTLAHNVICAVLCSFEVVALLPARSQIVSDFMNSFLNHLMPLLDPTVSRPSPTFPFQQFLLRLNY